MRTITKTVYQFSELDDRAKERAREWYRQCSSGDNFFAESVYDDAATIGAIMGIDLNQKPVKLMNGSTRYDPAIYYSGFWSQGDGACFESTYSYKPGALKALKAHIGGESEGGKELLRICNGLQAEQKKHFYKLQAKTQHQGRYYHAYCMDVDVWHSDDNYRDVGDSEETIRELLRDFANWIYSQLESAYEWENSDEVVDENIIGNEYEFDENGERAE